MTKTFLLKGHATNHDTVIMVLEGKINDEREVECEEKLGRDFARELYNTLPSGTLEAMISELVELHSYGD